MNNNTIAFRLSLDVTNDGKIFGGVLKVGRLYENGKFSEDYSCSVWGNAIKAMQSAIDNATYYNIETGTYVDKDFVKPMEE